LNDTVQPKITLYSGMSLVLPIIFHLIRRSSPILSTRPTSILNREVGLIVLNVFCVFLLSIRFQINFIGLLERWHTLYRRGPTHISRPPMRACAQSIAHAPTWQCTWQCVLLCTLHGLVDPLGLGSTEWTRSQGPCNQLNAKNRPNVSNFWPKLRHATRKYGYGVESDFTKDIY
jgi:hypothetical protein